MTRVLSGTSHRLPRDLALRVSAGRPDRSKATQLSRKSTAVDRMVHYYFLDTAQQPTPALGRLVDRFLAISWQERW
jgi:hypothetical protein